MNISSVFQSILAGLLRNWLAAILVILFSRHWVTEDQRNYVTTWFGGYADIIATTFLAAIVPVLLGLYYKLRVQFQIVAARMLPQDATHADVKEVVANSTYGQILSVSPSQAVVTNVVKGNL